MRLGFLATTALFLSFATATSPVMADEGMWMPHQTVGIAKQLTKAGLKLDPTKLGDFNAAPLNAIVSLGGCSASFVSPEGLVATNHHCVVESLSYVSSKENNYLANGFLAQSFKDELELAPTTRVFVIEDLKDVTKAMMASVTDTMTGTQRFETLEKNRKSLVAECEKLANRRCEVRSYFGGASYYLQQQLEIKDVRLVYAPAYGVGNFGGETDNWMWPRHTGDWGFYRAYVAPDGSSAAYSDKNVPFKPKAFLKIAKEGVKEGDFVMVAGFPGSNTRLVTAQEAKFSFEKSTPLTQKTLSEISDLVTKLTNDDKDARLKYASTIQGADNYKKKISGEIAGADAIDLNGKKEAYEAQYRTWIKADATREASFGAAATKLDALILEDQENRLDGMYAGAIYRSSMLSVARTAYRYAVEREKPEAMREAGFQARDKRSLTEQMIAVERRYVPRIDRAILEYGLGEYKKASEKAQDKAFLAKLSEIGLDALYAKTTLGDKNTRLGLLEKSKAELEAMDDPFMKLAIALYPAAKENEAKTRERSGQTQAVRSVYNQGLIAFEQSRGRTLYPDANGTLRFTYGTVMGKKKDGLNWTAFTTAEGLVAKHTGKGEFDAPDTLIAKMKAKDFGPYVSPQLKTLPINYLSTVDITNGNSGSATLNAKGEFVGLAFDGTLDGVISDWYYEPSINRTIHADSRYMLWTMDKVDGAERLLKEMGVK